jgi:hypothetical protein
MPSRVAVLDGDFQPSWLPVRRPRSTAETVVHGFTRFEANEQPVVVDSAGFRT